MASVARWGLLEALDRARRPLPWPEKLLIIGPAGLGDTVVALPALRRILRAAPATRVTWAGRAALRPLAEPMGVHAYVATDAPAGIATQGFGAIIAFAIVTESVFAWPGMGKLIIDSIRVLDRPVIVAYLMLIVVFFIIINLAVDVIYSILDPRVRLSEAKG